MFISISLAESKLSSFESKNEQITKEDSDKDEIVKKPIFLLKSGFYNFKEIKELTVSSNYTIFYTLNSTDPTISQTAQIYTKPIKMYD